MLVKRVRTLSHIQCGPRAERRRGLAAVELAFFLPVLLFCSMSVVDFSRLVYVQVTLQNCARNGALYEFYQASGYQLPSGTTLATSVAADAGALTSAGMTVTGTASSPKLSTNNYVTVTTTTVFTPLALGAIRGLPPIPSSITVTQTATMPYPASMAAVQ